MEDTDTKLPATPVKVQKKLNKRNLFVSRIKRRILSRHVWIVRITMLAGFLVSLLLVVLGVSLLFKKTGMDRYVGIASTFLFTPMEKIDSFEGRTNILVLGKAGEGHPAPDLTDTMILVSVSHGDNPKITMVSLPRDIWIEDMRAKLNSAYYWGNKKKEDGGMVLAKSTVEEITGVPVHYGVVIDFAGFTRLIDVLGGVDVEVERSFEDNRFPIPGRENDLCDGDPEYLCRYETIRFEKGVRHMDGETALKFVRSRHSEDMEEGTDFARSRRQQRVLEGIKQRVLSTEILLSPKRLRELRDAVLAMTETDISEDAMAILAKRGYQGRSEISNHSISEDLLENPPVNATYDNQYVFIPKVGDWGEVHQFIDSVLEE